PRAAYRQQRNEPLAVPVQYRAADGHDSPKDVPRPHNHHQPPAGLVHGPNSTLSSRRVAPNRTTTESSAGPCTSAVISSNVESSARLTYSIAAKGSRSIR